MILHGKVPKQAMEGCNLTTQERIRHEEAASSVLAVGYASELETINKE
jgi:hypothetical protein